jgi:hypothetical protein
MKSKLLHDENGLKTFALVFDKNEQVKPSLIRFAAPDQAALENLPTAIFQRFANTSRNAARAA